jgi:FkbM family methyltransferase
VYSQWGEHLDIEEVVGLMPHGYACDVGAVDGVFLNNTKQLEDRGWDVLCIEANPLYGKILRANRKLVMMVACGAENLDNQDFHVFEVWPGNYTALSALKPAPPEKRPRDHAKDEEMIVLKVNVRTLDTCLEDAGFPRLDVLTVDVEGGESEVLDGFTISRWQPKVIVLEDWEAGRHAARLREAGYDFKVRRGENDVFVLRSL